MEFDDALALLRMVFSDGEVAKEIIDLRLFPAASGNVCLWLGLVLTSQCAAIAAAPNVYEVIRLEKPHLLISSLCGTLLCGLFKRFSTELGIGIVQNVQHIQSNMPELLRELSADGMLPSTLLGL